MEAARDARTRDDAEEPCVRFEAFTDVGVEIDGSLYAEVSKPALTTRSVLAAGRRDSGLPARAIVSRVVSGDTDPSAATRASGPSRFGDAFLIALVDGRLHVLASPLERTRIADACSTRAASSPGGELRLENRLLVTDEGSETLTRYPHELTPRPFSGLRAPCPRAPPLRAAGARRRRVYPSP